MKKSLGAVVILAVFIWSGSCFAECLPMVGKADPNPVLSKLRMSKCLGEKIRDEVKVGEDRTMTVELEANQTCWVSASACVRVKRIFIGVFGPEGVMLQTDTGGQPAFCFRTEEAGKYTFLLEIKEAENIKKSNVNLCVTKSGCKCED